MVRSTLCTASAGAGKTYRLTEEVFQRIQIPNRFVVAVTFTRAAAAEMERRLLGEILSGEQAPPHPEEKLSLIMRASKVHFSTLDSLFYLFLSTESYVPQIAAEHEVTMIRRRASERFFQQFLQPGVGNQTNLLVILARILNIEPEKLTDTLRKESSFLMAWSCDEEELTDLRKKQEILKNQFIQLQTQVLQIAQTYDTEKTLKMLHSRVINHLLKPLKDQPAGCLITCKDLDEAGTGRRGIPEAQRNTEAYSKLKNLYPDLRSLVAEYIINTQKLRAALLRQFAHAYTSAMEEEKRIARRIFFEDVTRELADLDGGEDSIREDPGKERPILLARLYELGFHTVTDLFLDEFQDTSSIQLELLRPLLEEILSSVNNEAQGNRSIFLVGDWKQSIYQWREANPRVLEAWCKPYRSSGQLGIDMLSYNWRSTPLLIGFFNNLVQTLFAGTEREKELQFPPPSEKLKRPYRGFSKVEVIPVACERSDEPLYQRILHEIGKLKEKQGVALGDITILCRTHSHMKKVMETLAQQSIFTSSIKGREVLSTREGMALYLALAGVFLEERKEVQEGSGRDTPLSEGDVSSLAGLAYIGRALSLLGYGETLLPLVKKSKEEVERSGGPHRFSSLARILSLCEPHLPRTVIESVWTWGEEYFQYDEGRDIHSFLVEWRKNSSLITVPEPEHSERVKISTIHGVKGLEFPHVILLWKEESELFSVLPHPRERFPLSLSRKETREFLATEPIPGAKEFAEPYQTASNARKEETANLLYVAATRAKQSLTILVRASSDGSTTGFSSQLREACKSSDAYDYSIVKIEPRAQKTDSGWACLYGQETDGTRSTGISPPILYEQSASGQSAATEGTLGGDKRKPLSSLRITTPPPLPTRRELDPSYLSDRIETATARGSRIHQALSTVRPDGSYTDTVLFTEGERNVIRNFLSHPDVRDIIFRPGTVYTEQHLSDQTEFGIVDRLIVSSDRITLIDYKTGFRTPMLLEQYRTQMERYRNILSTLFPDRPLEAYLLFVDDEKNPIEGL